MSKSSSFKRNLPVIAASVRNIIIFITVLSIPLAAARELGLTPQQTSAWVLAGYAIPAVFSLVLVFIYRQPILLTGNLFVIIFISGLGGEYSFPELVGAAILAGGVVLAINLLGLGKWMASFIPIPIMFGLLAGAVLPFISDFFSMLGDYPLMIGGTVLVFLLSRALAGMRLPAILPALVVGFAITALTGRLSLDPESMRLYLPALTAPVFSTRAILTATPVFVVLIVLQSNLPSFRFLHSQGYRPPQFIIGIISGAGTMMGSLLGPIGLSLSLPSTSLLGGKGAGDKEIRHRTIYLVGAAGILIGVFSGLAVALAQAIPFALLLTLAGLSVVNVFANALVRITRGPLRLGPVFAFAIALSEISFLGFGNYFWSLVIGTLVSVLVEREGLRKLREAEKPEEVHQDEKDGNE